MNNARFKVIFAPEAAIEYEKLDNSVISIVDKAIDRLEERADEVGTLLHNYQKTRLADAKEIKLRDAGIRIIFKITAQTVNILQVVYILAIDQRDGDRVFGIAHERYQEFKEDPLQAIEKGKNRSIKKKGKK